ncbi:Dihydropteroate synthase [hydrothermal vent metagenome]|uniref:dihydropteroate synthase n=1 Tax=hydrothermal vent metagenome TaxID=652676 RepID=A0A3B1B6S7_9ZZZZ
MTLEKLYSDPVFTSCHGRSLDLSFPRIMGILNITPDSFSDGGRFLNQNVALRQLEKMLADGADIIDIGGESTRPGAAAVSVEEELARVIPVIKALRTQSEVFISVDTSKPEVMREAVAAGADMINDVRALREADALATVAALDIPVCLMHMQGQPRCMQQQPEYENVLIEVKDFLHERVRACEQAGIKREQIAIDPGFGFGKSLQHNLRLFHQLPELRSLGLPVLVGVSRKSMIAALLDIPVEERLAASVALAGLAVWLGAGIIRTHDVRETRDAVRMCHAVANELAD